MADPSSIREILLQELDSEEGATRRTLERVPAERWAWRPHEKSTPMGSLAGHVATLPSFVRTILTTDSFDVMNPPAGFARPQPPETAGDLVPTAARLFAEAREALGAARDEDLFAPWTLSAGGHTLLAGKPRHVALRNFFANHLVHHRAQLGVYLRLCNVPVPSVYGPSADEGL